MRKNLRIISVADTTNWYDSLISRGGREVHLGNRMHIEQKLVKSPQKINKINFEGCVHHHWKCKGLRTKFWKILLASKQSFSKIYRHSHHQKPLVPWPLWDLYNKSHYIFLCQGALTSGPLSLLKNTPEPPNYLFRCLHHRDHQDKQRKTGYNFASLNRLIYFFYLLTPCWVHISKYDGY